MSGNDDDYDLCGVVTTSSEAGSECFLPLEPEESRGPILLELPATGSSDASSEIQQPAPVEPPPCSYDSPAFELCPDEWHPSDAHPPAEREADMATAAKPLPDVDREWQRHSLRVLVVGPAHSGKSTLAHNLFCAVPRDASTPEEAAGDGDSPSPDFLRTAWGAFPTQHDKWVTKVPPQRDEGNRVTHSYWLQESPGLDGDTDAQVDILIELIQRQRELYRAQEEDLGLPREDLVDGRFDCCLFLVPPTQLSDGHASAIARLSACLPVLPCVGRADTLIEPEADRLRDALCRHPLLARQQDSDGPPDCLFRFSKAALHRVKATRCLPPFLVVTSPEVDGRAWPVRKYAWGDCEAFWTRDSDLLFLKLLLLEAGYAGIKAAAEASYRAYCVNVAARVAGRSEAVQPTPPAPKAVLAPTAPPPPPPPPPAVEAVKAAPVEAVGRPAAPAAPAPPTVKFVAGHHLEASVYTIQKVGGATPYYRLSLQLPAMPGKIVAVRIGVSEGAALQASAMVQPGAGQRPSTYDAWLASWAITGTRLKRVVIHKFSQTVFHAALHIVDAAGGEHAVDTRPSDALNLASRAHVKVFISKRVVEKTAKDMEVMPCV